MDDESVQSVLGTDKIAWKIHSRLISVSMEAIIASPVQPLQA